MKLLVLSPHFAPRFEGGTEVVARAQARELSRRGHDVGVLAGCDTPHRGVDLEREEVDGLSVAFAPRLEHERYDLLLERPRLLELVRAEARGVDAVHLHGWATLAGGLVRALASELPVVVTLHDLFVTCPRFFRLPEGGVERCGERGDVEACLACLRPDAPGLAPEQLRSGLIERNRAWQGELDAAAAVVLPSHSQRQRLQALVRLDPARTHVVPHGLCRPVEGLGGGEPWRGEGPLRVLHLGNLTSAKGVRELAEAAGRVARATGRVELVFAGQCVEPGLERELGRLAAPAPTTFLGPFDLLTLSGRLRDLGGCHLAVLLSRAHESYGLVVDEALALGLPVWVSDRGAPKERVGGAGLVLPAEDVSALARALEEALGDPGLLARQRSAVPLALPTAEDAARSLEGLLFP